MTNNTDTPLAPCGCPWVGIRVGPDGKPLDCGCGWGDICDNEKEEPRAA